MEVIAQMELNGLKRLLDTCKRLNLSLEVTPPEKHPPRAGTLLDGL
jgi:hypothetical protein